MQRVHSRLAGWFLSIPFLSLPFLPSTAAAQPSPRTGWAELSALAPATPIVVFLSDGRRLERYYAGTTAEQLIAINLSDVSRERRDEVLAMLRKSPHTAVDSLIVEEPGQRVAVEQRFARTSLVSVERPMPHVFKVPAVVNWLLIASGPCPDCDAAQTDMGRNPTPLPSPLPSRAGAVPEVVYRAPAAGPNPLDEVTWEQLRLLLPAALRTKEPEASR